MNTERKRPFLRVQKPKPKTPSLTAIYGLQQSWAECQPEVGYFRQQWLKRKARKKRVIQMEAHV